MPTSRKSPAPNGHPLAGSWSPEIEGDSNLIFTIASAGARLRVAAVDAYDGEKLTVSAVSWDDESVRFHTRTPSTGAKVEHELKALPRGRAEYRFTIAQTWRRS